MSRIEEIDVEIGKLKDELVCVAGEKTEVYKRVCGYYRNPDNFNAGKRAEADERVMFTIRGVEDVKHECIT